jgi:competence protein ComEC
MRLEGLDRTVLANQAGASAPARLEIVGPSRQSEFVVRVPVRVTRLWRREIAEHAQLELPADVRAPPLGAVVDAVVRIRLPRAADEESGFDEAAYLRRHGAHAVLGADRYRVIGRRGGLIGMADRLRELLARSIAPGLEGERRALVAGVVLGEDEGLSSELRDRFRSSGLYHLLAVSGQNVAYVVAGVLLAGWLVGVRRWLAQVAALAAVIGYVAAVGWQPSVIRAGVAGGLASLAWLAARPRDRWYFALVGAAVLLAWNPYSLLDPGFQLSFAAVAAIFVLVPRLERLLEGYPLPRRLTTVLAVSGACGLVTAPILWAHFGAIPVLSVPANVLAAPVVAPILGLGLAAAGAGVVLPGAAEALAWLNGWLVAYLGWCARAIGGVPFAQLESLAAMLGAVAAVPALVILQRVTPRLRRRIVAVTVAAGCIAALFAFWPRPSHLPPSPAGLRVSFLDVGQGDAALLQVKQGAVLVDQGPPEARVVRQLAHLGVDELALVVLTHPQRDHVGGAAEVLRTLEVEALLDPDQPVANSYEEEALEAADERGVRVVTARQGQVLELGRLVLRVLWPDGSARSTDDPNDHAIVLLASYGKTDVLLTADAESEVTRRLALEPVEVLKVAHHGSDDPGLAGLLSRLRPRVAVVSVGARNDYGHPTPSTLETLQRAPGLELFRTDQDGTVVVESDGLSMTVKTGA